MKDLNKKVRDKETEVEVLKEMVKSAQLQLKGKENEVLRLTKQIKRMQREGYVDKMQVQGSHHQHKNSLIRNNVQVNVEDLDSRDKQEQSYDDDQEENFYENSSFGHRKDERQD